MYFSTDIPSSFVSFPCRFFVFACTHLFPTFVSIQSSSAPTIMADSNTRMNIDIDSEDYLPPGALPYNAEPIASTSTSTHRSQADINALLDQPLSDSTSRMRGWGPGEGRRDREKNLEARGEMRDGAEELLGRISDRKVYTLEADGVGLSMGNNSQEGEDEEVDENEEVIFDCCYNRHLHKADPDSGLFRRIQKSPSILASFVNPFLFA